jgi:hypothetical protein
MWAAGWDHSDVSSRPLNGGHTPTNSYLVPKALGYFSSMLKFNLSIARES